MTSNTFSLCQGGFQNCHFWPIDSVGPLPDQEEKKNLSFGTSDELVPQSFKWPDDLIQTRK